MAYKNFKDIVTAPFKKKEESKPITYIKCSQIPMRNFDAAKTLEDYRWLVYGFTGFEEIEAPEDGAAIMYELMNEYCELDGNRQALDFYELQVEVSRLQVRQYVVDGILETMCCNIPDKSKLIEELSSWSLSFNTANDFAKEMDYMFRQQKGWLTKLKRKKAELDDFNKDEDGQEQEATTLLQQKIILEQILDKNHIDLAVISAEEFINLRKSGQEIVNQRRQWQARN